MNVITVDRKGSVSKTWFTRSKFTDRENQHMLPVESCFMSFEWILQEICTYIKLKTYCGDYQSVGKMNKNINF